MNTKSLVRLIKKANRESRAAQVETEVIADKNVWSRSVRLWVREFQENVRSDSPPSFDRLFQTNQRQS